MITNENRGRTIRVYCLQMALLREIKRLQNMINDDVVFADVLGNNPMVGATVACAVLVEEALKA